jgi:hypothetical protein
MMGLGLGVVYLVLLVVAAQHGEQMRAGVPVHGLEQRVPEHRRSLHATLNLVDPNTRKHINK